MSNFERLVPGFVRKVAAAVVLSGALTAVAVGTGGIASADPCVSVSGGATSNCGSGKGMVSGQGTSDDSASNGKVDYDGTQNADDRDGTQDAYTTYPPFAQPQYR